MNHYILTTFSLPTSGKEVEYNEWYDHIHCQDLLKIPEIKTAQRFSPLHLPGLPQSPFLAVYQIETDDIAGLMQALQNGSYQMRLSDAIDPTSVTLQVYEVMGEKQIA